jgi:hypothetical protein
MAAADYGLVVSQANGDVRTDHIPGHGRSVPLGRCPTGAPAQSTGTSSPLTGIMQKGACRAVTSSRWRCPVITGQPMRWRTLPVNRRRASLPARPACPVDEPWARGVRGVARGHVKCVPKWRITLMFAQVGAVPGRVCKIAGDSLPMFKFWTCHQKPQVKPGARTEPGDGGERCRRPPV